MPKRSTEDARQIARRLADWMFDDALPFWRDRGFRSSGLAFEMLDGNGEGIETGQVRVRTHARQVFSFAFAWHHDWQPRAAAAIVERSGNKMLQAAFRPDGLAGRVIDTDSSSLADDTADLYDTSCCLLALTWARNILGARETDEHIAQILTAIETHLASNDGIGESIPRGSERVQDPHMHFFEALLSVADFTGERRAHDLARRQLEFIDNVFFDRDAAIVREAVDTSRHEQSTGYRPGHSFEWVCLLQQAARLLDDVSTNFAWPLYGKALAAQRSYGDTRMELDGRNGLVDGSVRLWGQTEALKAHLEMADHAATQFPGAMDEAVSCARSIWDRWLAPAARGGWLDRFDDAGKPADATMPASTGYHLFPAIARLCRVTGSRLQP
jgi:mannose-6-phosphate isomerase